MGLWHSLFHAVSAFNNAGFALHPDSLSRWVGNPLVNIVIPALFILGGLGFIVVWFMMGGTVFSAFAFLGGPGMAFSQNAPNTGDQPRA